MHVYQGIFVVYVILDSHDIFHMHFKIYHRVNEARSDITINRKCYG